MPLPAVADLERLAADWLATWRVADTRVSVAWNPRLRTSAGRAFHKSGRIELNPHLLADRPAELRQVLVHEAAHVAASRLFGPRCGAHGRHWRSLMALAGLPPDPCHAIPTQQLRRRRYLYLRVCDACGSRAIARTVRYARCRCGAEEFLVMRATAGTAGLRALRALSLPEIRRQCIMADRPRHSVGRRTDRT